MTVGGRFSRVLRGDSNLARRFEACDIVKDPPPRLPYGERSADGHLRSRRCISARQILKFEQQRVWPLTSCRGDWGAMRLGLFKWGYPSGAALGDAYLGIWQNLIWQGPRRLSG
jgi:hypothetical protein